MSRVSWSLMLSGILLMMVLAPSCGPSVGAKDGISVLDSGGEEGLVFLESGPTDSGGGQEPSVSPDTSSPEGGAPEPASPEPGPLDRQPEPVGPDEMHQSEPGTEPMMPDAGEGVVEAPPEPVVEQPASCPQGMVCVSTFPFRHNDDTSQSTSKQFDRYNCKTTADESGPERIYRVEVKQAGFLSAAVYDQSGVDVDVHILSKLDANSCLHRGDLHAKADVQPGIYYVIVDTYVKSGQAQAGSYRVDIGLTIPSKGPCGMQTGTMERVRDNGNLLKMPATGPVVMEAHLVTQDEPPPYPSTSRDELNDHYELSQKKTGYVMHRTQLWAPLEGGTFYGAGIGSPTLFPTLHEAWYVNMYWTRTARPARGTRMILRVPGTNRAVVVAAGYETGPGDLNNIGGTTEETHYYLNTTHKSRLTLGIATDQTLPYGPRICQ